MVVWGSFPKFKSSNWSRSLINGRVQNHIQIVNRCLGGFISNPPVAIKIAEFDMTLRIIFPWIWQVVRSLVCLLKSGNLNMNNNNGFRPSSSVCSFRALKSSGGD